nr:hypothetical protein [Tanacetum cinerariifolium]
DDGTKVVEDLHLLRDGLAKGKDESKDLSKDESRDDFDVVGSNKVVKGVETTIAPATAEEKAQRRLELKEIKVKRVSSSSTNTQNMAFVSSSSNNNTNSSNEAVNTAFGVTTTGTQINATNSINIDNLSDAIICAFLAIQSNSSQLLNINGNETVSFDKTKVGCYNCHKRGHFTRECRAQDNRNRDITRRIVLVETTNSLALGSCDGLRGYDWSDKAEEGPNYALIAYSTSIFDSEMDSDSTYMVAASKVHMLKPGEYELWSIRMEQYILMVDYSLWEVIENEVKGVSSSSTNTQNMAFVSSSLNNNTNSSNEAVNTAFGVTTTGTQINAANSINIDNLSDAIICAFLARCYNCHKRGHFTRECRAQDNKNRDITRRNVLVETTNSLALGSCDGLRGYDWSDQAEEGPNYALIAYSTSIFDSEVSTDSNCLKTCLKTVETLKSQNERLLNDLRTSKIQTIIYKTCLESIEARLLVYKKNEFVYEEDIKLLKRKIYLKDIPITKLRRKLELAQKQKDKIQLIVENFKNSSKSLSKLLNSQIADKCKAGLGYNAVPPPYIGNFLPLKPNFSGLEEFVNEPIVGETTVKKPKVETLNAKTSKDVPKVVKKDNGGLIIEDWNSDDEDESVSKPKIDKKIVILVLLK